MGKSNLLINISLDIDTFKELIKRFSKDGYVLHELDKDLLLRKTRELYDNIHQLETYVGKEIEQVEKFDMDVEIPIEKVVEVEVNEEVVELKPEVIDTEDKEQESENIEEESENIEEETLDIDENEDVIIENHQTEEVNNVIPEEESESSAEKNDSSTIDLFSVSKETISDKFVEKDEKNLADKLQQIQLSDLRSAIGINEKFLFINELFNGDMGRYNKILDELNSMQSKTGLSTYLMELKIEKQWNEDMEAYIKFKELVDRRFV